MVDSHIKLPTASLYGQFPPSSPSSPEPSFAPGVAGLSEVESTPKRFSMLSINVFCVISIVVNPSHVRKHNQCTRSCANSFNLSRHVPSSPTSPKLIPPPVPPAPLSHASLPLRGSDTGRPGRTLGPRSVPTGCGTRILTRCHHR